MAYSNSTGTETGGSQDVSVIHEVLFGTTLYRIYQKATSTTTRYAGVSLSTAKNLCAASATLANYKLTYSHGTASYWYVATSCKGSKQSGTYRQIGDSNLYEVTLVSTTLAILKKNGTWDSSTSNTDD